MQRSINVVSLGICNTHIVQRSTNSEGPVVCKKAFLWKQQSSVKDTSEKNSEKRSHCKNAKKSFIRGSFRKKTSFAKLKQKKNLLFATLVEQKLIKMESHSVEKNKRGDPFVGTTVGTSCCRI